MIKTYALASCIYEDTLADNRDKLPFVHHGTEDVESLKSELRSIRGITSLTDMFGDYSKLDLEIDRSEYVPKEAME